MSIKFKSDVPFLKFPFSISFQDQIMLIGSCFSDNIGNILSSNKFATCTNPASTIYNPISIENYFSSVANTTQIEEKELFEYNGIWRHWNFHSSLSTIDKNESLSAFNNSVSLGKSALQSSNFIFITLGSAIVYRHLEQDKIVANCHQLPSKEFRREILSPKEITDSLERTLNFVKAINPLTKVIFTISPVRHLKEGMIENQRSKANLLSPAHEIIAENENCFYFPSYEILMDDLRDYRFYEVDLVHPNQLAIQYIWNYFRAVFFDDKTNEYLYEFGKIKQAVSHRAFNPLTEYHQKFLANTLQKIEVFEKKFSKPLVEEKEIITNQMIRLT